MPMIPLRDGQQLHVRTIGRGQPVLMLHGMGADSGQWLPFVLPHLHRFRFVLPDMRGAGKSGALRFNQPDIFQNHAEDMQDLVEHLDLQDYLLVGYSLGASTSLHMNHNGGFSRVRRYLHIDQSPCIGNREDWRYGLLGDQQDVFFETLRALEIVLSSHPRAATLSDLPPHAEHDAARLLSQAFSSVLGRTPLEYLLPQIARFPSLFSRLLPMARIADLRTVLACYANGGHDYRDSLRDSDTPVTVFVGMKSPIYPASGQMHVAELVKDGTVVRFEKSGHVPLLNEPLKFTRELGRFLRG